MKAKQKLWDWLKAENRYQPAKGELTPVLNRVQRRSQVTNWK